MAKKMPTSYPGRSPIPVPSDDLSSTGKGPGDADKKGGVAPVDTPSFTHRQDDGPGAESHTSLPSTKTPKTPHPRQR